MNAFSMFYFFFLFILVFFGEGKQEIVDVIGVIGIICLYAGHHVLRKRLPVNPTFTHVLWAALLLYFGIHTFFSDSVGYSITTTMRYVMAYVLFTLFSSRPTIINIQTYNRFALWFVYACAGASFFVIVFSKIGLLLPKLNLLYPSYGHNHIAVLIIFILPLIVDRFMNKRSITNVVLLLIGLVVLIFSFARGATLIALGYLVYRIVASRDSSSMKTLVFVTVAAVWIYGASVLLLPQSFTKDSVLQNRQYYWKQAIISIEQHPLFGTGPGTFSLISKRFQPEANRYSWYAHSYPLEILTESGVIGIIILAFLFGYMLIHISASMKLRSRSIQAGRSLFGGVVLTLLYSMYEINLNFIVVWFLLWSSVGILFSEVRLKKQKHNTLLAGSIGISVCVGILVVYSLLPIASMYDPAFESYNVNRVSTYIERLDSSYTIPKYQSDLFLYFHKKNPEFLYTLANAQPNIPFRVRNGYYVDALTGDRTNTQYWKTYIEFVSQKPKEMLPEAISLYISSYGSTVFHLNIPSPSPEEGTRLVDYVHTNMLPDDNDERNNFVRLFYGLGLASLSTNPERAKMWWTLARDSNPSWSYVHIELAGLARYIFLDEDTARGYLKYCAQFAFASEHCRYVASSGIPFPGSFREHIRAIPEVLQ